jgi:hypothetical protein
MAPAVSPRFANLGFLWTSPTLIVSRSQFALQVSGNLMGEAVEVLRCAVYEELSCRGDSGTC